MDGWKDGRMERPGKARKGQEKTDREIHTLDSLLKWIAITDSWIHGWTKNLFRKHSSAFLWLPLGQVRTGQDRTGQVRSGQVRLFGHGVLCR
jgi:hypothetical protein